MADHIIERTRSCEETNDDLTQEPAGFTLKDNAWRGSLGHGNWDMNYGSLAKDFGTDFDLAHKTGFSFLSGARDSFVSQFSNNTNKGNSAPIHAFFNLWKVFVGIGILTGPAAMSHCGIFLGVFGITFAGLMSLYSINIQAQTRHKLQSMVSLDNYESGGESTHFNEREEDEFRRLEMENSIISEPQPVQIYINNYAELGKAAFGKPGFVFVSLCLFVQQMCSVTAYFSFIQNYIPIAVALWIVIPFWLFLNIKKISYLSLFSLFAIISALMLVVYHSIDHIHDVPKTNLKYFDLANFPYFFGVSIFIFEGNCASLQIETSMKEPKKFKIVSVVGILSVIAINWILSTLAYTSYVDTVKDVVLFNLPPNFISTIVRISYSFGLIFSIPIQIAPMVDTMYRSTLLDDHIKLFREKPVSKYYASVILILLTCVLWAILIPWLQMFINLSGSLVGILTLAIIPIMFYNKAFADEISTSRWLMHWVMMVVMSAAGAVSIYYSLNNMIAA